MVSVQHLFVLTKECKITVCRSPPEVLPKCDYSLIEIVPNGNRVGRIIGNYVYGPEEGDYVSCVLDNPDLSSLLEGRDIVTGLKNLYININDEDKSKISEESPYPGESKFQKYVNTFVGGVASCLCTFHFMWYSNPETGSPFYPIEVCFPHENINISLINRSMFQYLSYYLRVMKSLKVCCIGKAWLAQVESFWCHFGGSLPEGTPYQNDVAIYGSVLGFAEYFESQVGDISERIEHLDFKKRELNDTMERSRSGVMRNLSSIGKDHEDRFRKSVSVLSLTVLNCLEKVKTKHAQHVENLDKTGESLSKNMIEEIDYRVKEASSKLDNISSTTTQNIDQCVNEGVRTIGNLHEVSLKEISESGNKGVDAIISAKIKKTKEFEARCSGLVNDVTKHKEKAITDIKSIKSMKAKEIAEAVARCKMEVERGVSVTRGSFETYKSNMKTISSKCVDDLKSERDRIVKSVQDSAKKIAYDTASSSMKSLMNSSLTKFKITVDDLISSTIEEKIKPVTRRATNETSGYAKDAKKSMTAIKGERSAIERIHKDISRMSESMKEVHSDLKNSDVNQRLTVLENEMKKISNVVKDLTRTVRANARK